MSVSQFWIFNMVWSCGKGLKSYQYLSSPKQTEISLATSSRLSRSTFLLFFKGLDDEPPPLGVVFERLKSACMVEELGWSDGFDEEEGDGGVVIKGDGWMTLSGFLSLGLGFFLLDFLIDFEILGVFIVGLKREKKKDFLWRVNGSYGLEGVSNE